MKSKFAIAGIGAATPLGEAAPALLLAKAEPLFVLEEAARGGADADAVHDMRVASRRLREAMRLLAPLYPGREFGRWYRRIRKVTRALGPVRDSDVFIEEFSHRAPEFGEGGRRAVAFFVGHRTGRREHELAVLNRQLVALDLERNRASLDDLAHAVAGTPDAARPFADFAHAAVAERAAAVFGAQPEALDERNMAEQHALRIDYKRLRYAVEAFAPCYEDDFEALHPTLVAFQDALGVMHDLHVFLDLVRDPDLAVAAGRAGVSAEDRAEVDQVLVKQAHEAFERFVVLAAEHPAERLIPSLLLPLARGPVRARVAERATAASEAAAASALGDEIAVPSPVEIGAEPWAEEWESSGFGLDRLVPPEEPVER
jgi:CHAD domain-containing protein